MAADSWIEALAEFLGDNEVGTCGTDIFVGRRSDDQMLPDAAVVLNPVPGTILASMGGGAGDIWQPRVNVYVRGNAEDFPGTWNRIEACVRLLRQIGATSLHGIGFVGVGHDSDPTITNLGRDANRRPELSCDLQVYLQAVPLAPVVFVP